jgi:O-antigen/teichoic acid export membrane protein
VLSRVSAESKALQARLLSGSFVLLAGSGFVTAINFIYNIAVARFLGPTGFGHATAVYTLLVLISAVTLSFQIVSAKVVAQQGSLQAKSAAYRGFHWRAWICGILVGLSVGLLRGPISAYLNLPSPILVVLLGIGVAFYVPLGARRGYIQGACGFHHLAGNLVLEGLVRLGGSLLLILLGFGVTGVIAANAMAVAMAYLFAAPALSVTIPSELRVPVAFREGLQAIVFFIGQVAINNCDIVVVKHFFPSTLAGLYAAVALVGRVIFAFSWSVVNSMFPIVAGTRSQKRQDHGVLATSLLLVLAIGLVLTLGLRLAPAKIWILLFGAQFGVAGESSLPYLLALYAAAASVYSLSVVIIAYEMSHKIANTGWVQLSFSGALIVGIYLFHSSLAQVILVQLVMMLVLLMVVAAPFLREVGVSSEVTQSAPQLDRIRLIRRVSEDEVVSEFLKNDFHNPEFKDYQSAVAEIVATPNLDDASENALRRALLFVRHGTLWRELPKKTEWFEVEVRGIDLQQIRVFPRAQWRKLARGNFAITEIVRCIAEQNHDQVEDAFLSKIRRLRLQLCQRATSGAILLIGLDNKGPFTILDGNHRMVAATLISPEAVNSFRFFCGLSPRMDTCCWHETNIVTLVRYGANLVRHLVYDPEAEILRQLQGS